MAVLLDLFDEDGRPCHDKIVAAKKALQEGDQVLIAQHLSLQSYTNKKHRGRVYYLATVESSNTTILVADGIKFVKATGLETIPGRRSFTLIGLDPDAVVLPKSEIDGLRGEIKDKLNLRPQVSYILSELRSYADKLYDMSLSDMEEALRHAKALQNVFRRNSESE